MFLSGPSRQVQHPGHLKRKRKFDSCTRSTGAVMVCSQFTPTVSTCLTLTLCVVNRRQLYLHLAQTLTCLMEESMCRNPANRNEPMTNKKPKSGFHYLLGNFCRLVVPIISSASLANFFNLPPNLKSAIVANSLSRRPELRTFLDIWVFSSVKMLKL